MKIQIFKIPTRIKLRAVFTLLCSLLLAAFIAVNSQSALTASTQRTISGGEAILYTHIATAYNSVGDWTDLNNAVTNNNPHALVFVTPNWEPYHVYNNHPIGVWYHDGVWSIFNQDHTPMPAYAAFNVVVLTTAITGVFVHIATRYNSAGDYTDLYSSSTNNQLSACVFVTPNWAPYSVYNNHNIGVWYHTGRWSIFNQDDAAIPATPPLEVFIDQLSRSLNKLATVERTLDSRDLTIA